MNHTSQNKYVIGLDYGTDSVRAILVDAHNGTEMATHVHWYQRWKKKAYCNDAINQFRQHPLDHLEGLESTVKAVIKDSGVNASDIKSICIDTTGSSPLPLSKDGKALVFTPGFEDNPNAMMILWKDHTAIKEAEEINRISATYGGINYTKYVGGIYSSEWFWAKILHIIRQDEKVKSAAYTWMEHCDYLTYILVGGQHPDAFKRSRCAAGHKAMWHKSWDGLPDEAYLSLFDPYLGDLRARLYEDTFTSDTAAGKLCHEWATKLGLTTDTIVAVGTFDAHAGAIGAKVEKNTLVRVMGTSTCDIMVTPLENLGDDALPGICGQVDGSVITGMIGLEAGQSAFGDLLAWYKEIMMWPIKNIMQKSNLLTDLQKEQLNNEFENQIINELASQARDIPNDDVLPIALDWINGRRTPDADQSLKCAISNLSLGSKAPHIFKALVNSICFGSKKIVDRFEEQGVEIEQIIGIGGVARKSPYIMQTLADVLNKPIIVATSDYTPALGVAIYASVAAGIYDNVGLAAQKLGSNYEAHYFPNPVEVEKLKAQMAQYDLLAKYEESNAKYKNTTA
jgi:L-ribulokinase